MAKEVFMPKAGMDMQEGRIIRWLAEEGDSVRAGQPILEIETDKVTMEVEAPRSGILLRKYFGAGAVVPVVTIIGYIGEEGEQVPDRPSMAGGMARAQEAEKLRADDRRKAEKGYDYRVAVIGGGAAGIRAALKSARMGRKTILFEKKEYGGTCTNSGSLPMKIYLHTAKLLDELGALPERGVVSVPSAQIDMEKVLSHKDSVIGRMRARDEALLGEAGVDIIREEAEMIGRHHIRAGRRTFKVENTILCCGSVPAELDVPGADQPEIMSSDDMFSIASVPAHLLIIGGGVIGCEMAAAWSRFGSEVTIVEMRPQLLATFDAEISAAVQHSFEERGIRVLTGGKVDHFERKDGKPVLCLSDGTEIGADAVLVSVGRKPELSALGVLRDRIDFERGKVMVDEFCRTSAEDVFACGDMTNRSILAHSAMKMGESAASTACGVPKEVHLNRAPLNLYTVPEAAGIGLTESQARRRGEVMIGRCPLSLNTRAVACGQTEGFVKVIADRAYGEILGVHIVGGMATEMIVEAKTMMDMEITVYEVCDIMHAHPTWSEAFMEACADAIGESMSTGPKRG